MIISLALLFFQLIVVALGVWIGYKRGVGRSVIRLVELVAIGAVSLLLGRTLSDLFAHRVWAAIAPFFRGSLAELVAASPELEELLVGFVGALFVPLLFAALFALLSLLTLILLKKRSCAIVKLVTKKEGKPNTSSRLIGLGVGAVSAVLVALVLFSPAYTALSLVGGLSDESIEFVSGALATKEGEAVSADVGRALAVRPTNLGLNVEGTLKSLRSGAGPMASLLSLHLTGHDTPHGDHYDAVEEAYVVINAVAAAIEHTKHCEQNAAGSADAVTKITHMAKAALPKIAGHPFAKELVVDAAVAVGTYLKDGGELGGISTHTGDFVADLMVGAMADVLKNTTVDNLSATTNTLFGVGLDHPETSEKETFDPETTEPETTAPAVTPVEPTPTVPSDTDVDTPDAPTDPVETAKPEADKPRVPVKTTQGALEVISSVNFNNASELFRDDDQCLSLIEAVYLLDKNPTFAPMVSAFGDLGQKMLSENSDSIMPNLTEESFSTLYDSLVRGVEYELVLYGDVRSLQERAGTVRDSLMSISQMYDFHLTENQSELGAICLVIRFYTPEYLNDPNLITREDFRAYLGVK